MERSLVWVVSVSFFMACGAPSTPVDAGAGDMAVLDSGLPDAGATGPTVSVVSGATSRSVDLSTLPTRVLGPKTVVGLELVLRATFPELEGTGVKVGFKASDGFDPASRGGCVPLLPLAETHLARGGIEPLTRNLAWDDSLGYPGCLYVRDCSTLTLSP
jgi:hypothetical protein